MGLDNSMRAVLAILKSPGVLYNSNSLSKVLGLSSMGTLKILKRLEQEDILESEPIGKAIFYRIKTENEHTKKYVEFALSKETLESSALVKRWVAELEKIGSADIAVLFGSAIKKSDPGDIDVLLVTDRKRFEKLKKEVDEINQVNIKKIHPIYQSFVDLAENIRKGDKVILNAIKGIVVFGGRRFIEVYGSCRK